MSLCVKYRTAPLEKEKLHVGLEMLVAAGKIRSHKSEDQNPKWF